MPTLDDIIDTVSQTAFSSVESPAGKVVLKTAEELKALQNLVANTGDDAAIDKPHRGLRFTRLSPPGGG